ncbi:MAG TPA: M28 family metallopeptidase [Gammaproteobacteria bacterium]|nr:M28 family metallopeptidase [Gammaproteobacteria bacterium]
MRYLDLLVAMLLPGLVLATEPPPFSEANLRDTIKTLSSDAYGGRAPGTEGERLTLDYISGRFKSYGLAPANGNSYLQDVPLKQITADPQTELDVTGGATPLSFHYGDDMVASTPRPEKIVELKDSPLVFAGYGIVAPEWGWDDYAGLDVKGKTVVVLVNDPGYASGDPTLFEGKTMTYYGRWTYKYEEAARQGAAGVLVVHDTGPAGYPWEVVRGSWTGPLEELQPGKEYHPAVQGWLSHDAAERLFAAAGLKFDELSKAAAAHGFKPVPLALKANITLHNDVKDIISHNVVAVIKGASHPEDVVVYTAHWDHLGTKTAADGKTAVFHGAVDNASGIAGLLEIARRFASTDPKPARSVLFIATTCEEQGLLGAQYYASHPLWSLAHTVVDLNMDVLDTFGATRDVTVRGRFMSGADDALIAAAKSLGLAVEEDSQSEKGLYFRADHFEFAKAGVPALSIALGTDYVGRTAGWGLEQQQAYTRERYHKPADVYEPGWDLAGMQQQLGLMYLTGAGLAGTGTWPEWRAGSPFRALRLTERPAAP